MRICTPESPNYKTCRRISNARFDYCPASIWYCKNAGHVQTALQTAKEKRSAVRVRSGGHHHEGMCSGDGVLIVDVSEIKNIDFAPDLETVWIGAGARLA